jgi:hypothetical protein
VAIITTAKKRWRTPAVVKPPARRDSRPAQGAALNSSGRPVAVSPRKLHIIARWRLRSKASNRR